MKYIFVLLALFSTLTSPLAAKIRILTFHYNKPDFIELQHRTLEKFLQDDYELIVFNDARDEKHIIDIRNTCEKLGITCVRYEPEWHFAEPLNEKILSHVLDPTISFHLAFEPDLIGIANHSSVRHCHTIQYALDHYGYNHDDLVVILDADFFPIRPVSIRALISGKGMVGPERYFAEEGIGYMWVPFIALDMPNLPDHADLKFHVDVINNKFHDTGAHSYHYLWTHPQVIAKKYFWHGSTSYYHESESLMYAHGFNAAEIELSKTLPWPQCVEFHIDHLFLHFAGSSFSLEGHDIKAEHVKRFLNKILDN